MVKQKSKFINTGRIGRIRHQLLSGWWSRKADLSAKIAWGQSDITYSLEGEAERWLRQHKSPGRIRHHLLSRRWSRKATSSVQIARRESDITYVLEGEGKGEFISTDWMGRIRRHILSEGEAERWICQCKSHGKNWTSLTLWKVKGKGEFVSTDHMGRIRHHLLPRRWREKVNSSAQITWRESNITYKLDGEADRQIHQHRSHGENQTSLTSWKVKGKGEFISTDCMERIGCHLRAGRWRGKMNSSAQITWGESDITYFLEGQGGAEFISADRMSRIRCHLLPRQWREKVNLSAQITWRELDVTYFLEGEGERWIHQRRLHGKNQMSLTFWKVKVW